MVVLSSLPDPSVVRALRGKVDFYQDKGRYIARSWPRKSLKPNTLPEVQMQDQLRRSNQVWRLGNSYWMAQHWLSTYLYSYVARDMFNKYRFGTVPWHPPFPGLDRAPRQSYPLDDPEQNFWSVSGMNMHYVEDGLARFTVRIEDPVNPILVWSSSHAPPSLITYRRRGLTFNGFWHFPPNPSGNGSSAAIIADPPFYSFNITQPTFPSPDILLWCWIYARNPSETLWTRAVSPMFLVNVIAKSPAIEGFSSHAGSMAAPPSLGHGRRFLFASGDFLPPGGRYYPPTRWTSIWYPPA